ncbi:MAG: helicase HerA domain-containing protein [Halobacteriota archaeon]
MTDTETITVADVRDGPGGDDVEAGTAVSLPVVEILTGRGFVTGKSGSGKSNTASVVIENLLDNGFPVMIIDTDGEYYGLKEEYEILHAGADEECDIQVSPEHAERLAMLALEQNVPIILDVSGYLDDAEAKELLTATARQLFAKEKKLKKPFLMVVEEVHEYIPEGGGMDETGRMLIKIGKRGRKHGLGILGISQRPADVKKDYITQCDWLVWHRLTWRNDTKVVGRILGSEYAEEIEGMGDGEAFLVTDWSESVRRVQFRRKQTFDAGATPGLDDFERPELKSVSGDLVAELRDITNEQERRESELADLRQQLEKRDQRIRQLEQELDNAKDLKQMADKFAQAMLQKAEAPYRGGEGRNLSRPDDASQVELDAYELDDDPATDEAAAAAESAAQAAEHGYPGTEEDDPTAPENPEALDAPKATPEEVEAAVRSAELRAKIRGDHPLSSSDGDESASTGRTDDSDGTDDTDGTDAPGDSADTDTAERQRPVVDMLTAVVGGLDPLTRGMLEFYRRMGVADPVDAHVAAGGAGNHELAYSRNRRLRRAGFVAHVGVGKYEYVLAELVREEYDDRLTAEEISEIVDAVESAFAVETPVSTASVDNSGDE